ncbi:Germin-like protein subfamily 1 member 14 [Morella rubra]|uniref:Germin-like protein n=1 Tax=Morella rubra TaxID=262757 RepID=A0A6A1V7M5_9ROSI|nr:Germin-like protein subfamily 1 member 14 [Morella rubra]
MEKGVPMYLVTVLLFALACSLASASDPSPLQDFCVAINGSISAVFVNGKFCKDPKASTLGISLARIDFVPYGVNSPHLHPLGTEITMVVEGTLYVGFVTSDTDNRLFTKVLNKGDVFVFPIGHIHFEFNVGKTNAVAFAGFSSQNLRVITIADAVFGSNPPINFDVLTKAFQVDKNVINYLEQQFK